MTKVDNQNENSKPATIGERLAKKALDHLGKMNATELAIFFFKLLFSLIIFVGGVKTMVIDVVKAFPIPIYLHLPIGVSLMVLLVTSAKLLTEHLADMIFNAARYERHYKIALPITTMFVLLFTWSVQTESAEKETTAAATAQLQAFSPDSTTLNEIDAAIARINTELDSANAHVAQLSALKARRRGGWLSESESLIFSLAQKKSQTAMPQLTALVRERTAEQARMQQLSETTRQLAEAAKARSMTKSKSVAGLAELALVVVAIFGVAFRSRFKSVSPDSAESQIEEFPKNLPIEQREQMLPLIKALAYQEESHHLIVELAGKRLYYDMPKLIKQAASCHSRLGAAQSEESQNTQLRNIAYMERIMALTPMQPPDLKRVFGYTALNLDYWNSETGNVSVAASETLQNRYKTASQRPATQEVAVFETY